jgi:hypothetical protein
MRFLKLFEEFAIKELHTLIDNNLSYIKIPDANKPISTSNKKYNEIINLIKNYNISNFDYYKHEFEDIEITPDNNFKKLLSNLNKYLSTEDIIDVNQKFQCSITSIFNNQFDFEYGIPKPIRKLGLGYKLYKLVLFHEKWILSDFRVSKPAKKIWYHLMLDKDLLCFTSNYYSGVILKTIDNSLIKSILDKLKPKYQDHNIEYIFDDYLKDKIMEIYGDLYFYKR